VRVRWATLFHSGVGPRTIAGVLQSFGEVLGRGGLLVHGALGLGCYILYGRCGVT
jgi:hypothetical protein